MKKQLFNEAGLLALQQMLYALTANQLKNEVNQLTLNFRGWVISHFELNERQDQFFGQLPTEVMQLLTYQTAFAIGNKLPIRLSKTGTASKVVGAEDEDKLFRPKSSLYFTANATGGYEAGGELAIEVSYQT